MDSSSLTSTRTPYFTISGTNSLPSSASRQTLESVVSSNSSSSPSSIFKASGKQFCPRSDICHDPSSSSGELSTNEVDDNIIELLDEEQKACGSSQSNVPKSPNSKIGDLIESPILNRSRMLSPRFSTNASCSSPQFDSPTTRLIFPESPETSRANDNFNENDNSDGTAVAPICSTNVANTSNVFTSGITRRADAILKAAAAHNTTSEFRLSSRAKPLSLPVAGGEQLKRDSSDLVFANSPLKRSLSENLNENSPKRSATFVAMSRGSQALAKARGRPRKLPLIVTSPGGVESNTSGNVSTCPSTSSDPLYYADKSKDSENLDDPLVAELEIIGGSITAQGGSILRHTPSSGSKKSANSSSSVRVSFSSPVVKTELYYDQNAESTGLDKIFENTSYAESSLRRSVVLTDDLDSPINDRSPMCEVRKQRMGDHTLITEFGMKHVDCKTRSTRSTNRSYLRVFEQSNSALQSNDPVSAVNQDKSAKEANVAQKAVMGKPSCATNYDEVVANNVDSNKSTNSCKSEAMPMMESTLLISQVASNDVKVSTQNDDKSIQDSGTTFTEDDDNERKIDDEVQMDSQIVKNDLSDDEMEIMEVGESPIIEGQPSSLASVVSTCTGDVASDSSRILSTIASTLCSSLPSTITSTTFASSSPIVSSRALSILKQASSRSPTVFVQKPDHSSASVGHSAHGASGAPSSPPNTTNRSQMASSSAHNGSGGYGSPLSASSFVSPLTRRGLILKAARDKQKYRTTPYPPKRSTTGELASTASLRLGVLDITVEDTSTQAKPSDNSNLSVQSKQLKSILRKSSSISTEGMDFLHKISKGKVNRRVIFADPLITSTVEFDCNLSHLQSHPEPPVKEAEQPQSESESSTSETNTDVSNLDDDQRKQQHSIIEEEVSLQQRQAKLEEIASRVMPCLLVHNKQQQEQIKVEAAALSSPANYLTIISSETGPFRVTETSRHFGYRSDAFTDSVDQSFGGSKARKPRLFHQNSTFEDSDHSTPTEQDDITPCQAYDEGKFEQVNNTTRIELQESSEEENSINQYVHHLDQKKEVDLPSQHDLPREKCQEEQTQPDQQCAPSEKEEEKHVEIMCVAKSDNEEESLSSACYASQLESANFHLKPSSSPTTATTSGLSPVPILKSNCEKIRNMFMSRQNQLQTISDDLHMLTYDDEDEDDEDEQEEMIVGYAENMRKLQQTIEQESKRAKEEALKGSKFDENQEQIANEEDDKQEEELNAAIEDDVILPIVESGTTSGGEGGGGGGEGGGSGGGGVSSSSSSSYSSSGSLSCLTQKYMKTGALSSKAVKKRNTETIARISSLSDDDDTDSISSFALMLASNESPLLPHHDNGHHLTQSTDLLINTNEMFADSNLKREQVPPQTREVEVQCDLLKSHNDLLDPQQASICEQQDENQMINISIPLKLARQFHQYLGTYIKAFDDSVRQAPPHTQ